MVKVICGDSTEKYSEQVKDALFNYIISNHILPGMYDWDALKDEAEEIIRRIGTDKKEAGLITKGDETE